MIRRYLVWMLLLGLSAHLSALESGPLQAAAGSHGWQRLVHYQADGLVSRGLRSAIHSEAFFLASDGATNPLAELGATIEAMAAPVPGSGGDQHAACRFPARRQWLLRHFPEFQHRFTAVDCPAFAAWAPIADIDSVSIVFANGYLGNPASYYGHTFLKFNARRNTQSYLVDQTVNFGAIDTAGDNPAWYIAKAISGGYEAGFSQIDFFFHSANYRENELRDLWEYRLNLSPEDVRYVVAHAWEVTQKRYTYYFFHDNCAHRAAELLEILEGVTVSPPGRPWVIPQAVLQTVARQSYRGQPLVAERRVHPSRQTRLYRRYAKLDREGRVLVDAIVSGQMTPGGPEMQAQPLDRQYAVLDTVMDYHQFRRDPEATDQGRRLAPGYLAALGARLDLPPGDAPLPEEGRAAPDTGNPPGWVQVGWGREVGGREFTALRIRPAYYDPLDVSIAQARNGGLSMGDIELMVGDGRARLHHLDLVSVDSINPSVTGLPGDEGRGWRIKLGWERERVGCDDCVVPRLQGDYSLGGMIGGSGIFVAAHAGAAVQDHGRFDGPGFVRVGLSALYRRDEAFGLRAGFEQRQAFALGKPTYGAAWTEIRWALGARGDLRVRWENDGASRWVIGTGVYW